MNAVVETGGKQYHVTEGCVINIEKVETEVNKQLKLDNVLCINTEKETLIGTPYIKGATIECKVLAQDKAKKIIVFKRRRRKGFHKTHGHRQPFTRLLVEKINVKSTRAKKTQETEEKE